MLQNAASISNSRFLISLLPLYLQDIGDILNLIAVHAAAHDLVILGIRKIPFELTEVIPDLTIQRKNLAGHRIHPVAQNRKLEFTGLLQLFSDVYKRQV